MVGYPKDKSAFMMGLPRFKPLSNLCKPCWGFDTNSSTAEIRKSVLLKIGIIISDQSLESFHALGLDLIVPEDSDGVRL